MGRHRPPVGDNLSNQVLSQVHSDFYAFVWRTNITTDPLSTPCLFDSRQTSSANTIHNKWSDADV